MSSLVSSLVGAGASLLGSIFGRKKKEETVNRVDYARMVQDAEAAGFNPLTALRNGGAAGFSVSTTPGTPLSTAIGQGLAAGTQSFLANFDPFADQKREAEYNLVQAQIANLNASTDAFRSRSFNVPGYGAGNVERRPSGAAGQLAAGRVLLDQSGAEIKVGPGSQAEEWEQEYGEVAGELEGFPRYLRDRVVPALKNPGTYGLSSWDYFTVPSFEWPALESAPPKSRRPARPGQNIPATYGRWNP